MVMNKADSKEQWIKAWKTEIQYLSRMYQCNADSKLFDEMKSHIDSLKKIVEEIADRMEKEGVWTKGQGRLTK
jgi:uncharacterized FAD-dependent dehydrogenase